MYIALGVAATENVVNGAVDPEFDGHYADIVTLSFRLIPEPKTVSLLAAALLGLGTERSGRLGYSPGCRSADPLQENRS